jgi:hypothetical protein
MRRVAFVSVALLVVSPSAVANPRAEDGRVAEESTTSEPSARDDREVDFGAEPARAPMDVLHGASWRPREFDSLLPPRYASERSAVSESARLEDPMPPEIKRHGCGACSSAPESAGTWQTLCCGAVLLLWWRRRSNKGTGSTPSNRVK